MPPAELAPLVTLSGLARILATLLPPSELARAQTLARESGEPIDSVCTRLGLCTERDLVQAIATSLRIEAVGPKDLLAKPAIADSINPRFLLTSRALPLSADDDHMVVAMVDPTDEDAIRGLEFAAERRVDRRVCSATDFEAAWQRLYGAGADAGQDTADHQSNADDVERLQDFASDAPVIRTVNQIVARAIDMLASDIHIEPNGQEYRVRFRLDGMLAEIEGHPAAFGMSVVSRIKIMARLNIAERRLAQDGRFSVSARGQKVDLRVATTPTVHGEAVVLRILDSERVPLDTRALGFSPVLEARWTQLLDRPHGIVLVTGPTGSGKSTTLYAGLTRLNQPDRKLLTIEDPVEQQIDGVNQVHARPEIGFGFGAALRAFLRHDPDVIMVGEIRDLETARTAIQAALTGHLILSTLHTNDAVSGITRLLDMGIDAYLIASTVNGILAQRLVRTICQGCRAHATAAAGSAIICQLCGGSGYKGRTTIGELLLMTPEMRSLVERLDSFELLLDA